MITSVPGQTLQTAQILIDLHNSIADQCRRQLEAEEYAVWEEVLIRLKRRGEREMVNWSLIKVDLETYFGLIINVKLVKFRARLDMPADSEGNRPPPFRLLKDAAMHIASHGHGNDNGGFALPGWDRELTERLISTKHNVGNGFHNSADRLETAMTTPPPALPSPSDSPEQSS